ncbi:hypothetical protein LSH36_259g04032 [Paralvinella palmiformis]|uniref:Uncharacterized protein n=1 Tax=Paralvinella palmiformis TaxID=53620 RepID=A0AAD9JK71_9ANNE|nr:hypothetical protein LSH36_259g04032 [Paralvinella palmiformis]
MPEESRSGPLYCQIRDPLADKHTTKAPSKQQARRQVSELWRDIEDLLALESCHEFAEAKSGDQTESADTELVPSSRNPSLAQTTPDFSVLIAGQSTDDSSPDSQEVPYLPWIESVGSSSEQQTTRLTPSSSFGSDLADVGNLTVENRGTLTNQTVDLAESLSSVHDIVLTVLNPVSVKSGASGSSTNERNRQGTMESVLHARNPLVTDYCHYEPYGNGFDVMDDVDSFMRGGPCGVVLEERIRYACTVLDIPMDPNSWTVDQVQKWAMFVLKRDDGVILDTESIMGLTLDGATLTQMTKDDLISYFPTIGETLYNELEVWCFGLTSPLTGGALSQLPSEPEYVDLDNFTKNKSCDVINAPYPSSPLQSQTNSMTSSIPSVASPDDVLLPPLCSLVPGHQAYIKPEVREHDDCSATCSDLSSVATSIGGFSSYSGYSPSSSSCGNSSTDDFYDDHESTSQSRGHVISDHRHGGKHTIQLWQFLKNLLLQPQYESYIRWLDRGKGIFKIEDSAYVAKLWGRRKNRPAMNYDKLSRSIRQYYKKGIIKKTGQSKRLVYQFCPQYNS